MSWLNDLSLTCKEATLLMVKQQENVLSRKEKFRMYVHLLLCAVCRLFYQQTNQLDQCLREACTHDELLPDVKMDAEKKKSLQQKIIEGNKN